MGYLHPYIQTDCQVLKKLNKMFPTIINGYTVYIFITTGKEFLVKKLIHPLMHLKNVTIWYLSHGVFFLYLCHLLFVIFAQIIFFKNIMSHAFLSVVVY